jgi:superfamily II DNA or RNA helicase
MIESRDLFHDPRPRPRDYQHYAVEAMRGVLRSEGRACCEAATGTGKTLIEAMLSEHYPKTLLIDPQINLVHQLAKGVERYRLRSVEIEQANNWANPDAPIVVASLDTLRNMRRAERFTPDLVIVDEAHYGLAPSTRAMLDYYADKGAHIAGFTATPHQRPDGSSPLDYFGSCPVQYGVAAAIEHGWLTPIRARRVVIKSADYTGCKVFGDFSSQEVERILRSEAALQEACALVAANHDAARSGAVYCASIDHAEDCRMLLESRHRIPTACVHSRMSPAQRQEELSRFESGEAKLICNVACLRMGWDSQRCSEIHVLRPIASLPAYIQTVGRGLRPDPKDCEQPTEYLRRLAIKQGRKSDCLLIDYTDTHRYHRVCSAIDVVIPRKKQKYREALIRRTEEQDMTLAELQQEARDEERREAERARAEMIAEKERRSECVVGVTFESRSADVFAKPTAVTPKRQGARLMWGPYKGELIRLVPRGYLQKHLAQMKRSPGNEWLVKAIKRELTTLEKERA